MEDQFRGNEQGGEGVENAGEVEQTVETISEETFKKMGEAAEKAVDLDALIKEVEEKTVVEENPNAGYEILAEGREEMAGKE